MYMYERPKMNMSSNADGPANTVERSGGVEFLEKQRQLGIKLTDYISKNSGDLIVERVEDYLKGVVFEEYPGINEEDSKKKINEILEKERLEINKSPERPHVKYLDLIGAGYKIEEVIDPKKEDFYYNNKFIYEQIKDVVKNHPELPMLRTSLGLADFLQSPAFIDNVSNHDARRAVENTMSRKAVGNSEITELFNYYQKDKMSAGKLTNPLKLLLYPKEVFGEKFEINEEIKTLSDQLRFQILSEDNTNKDYLDQKKYRNANTDDKKKAVETATKLSKAICVQLIEIYKDKEQKT